MCQGLSVILNCRTTYTWPLNLFKYYQTLTCIYGSYFCLVEKAMAPTPVFLPGKSHGWRSLVGCSPWGRYESDMTERLHFHFSLSCIGLGNGNPLQCSCLENPRDREAWWAAVYGVAHSRTQLKRLSSSSNRHYRLPKMRIQKQLLDTALYLYFPNPSSYICILLEIL